MTRRLRVFKPPGWIFLDNTTPANPHTENVTVEGPATPFVTAGGNAFAFSSTMSLQTQQQHDQAQDDNQHPTRIQCTYHDCSEHGYNWEFHHGKFCSNTCETKHRGRRALESCRYDHTRCFTCLRPLKSIEPPKPDFEFTENGHGWTRDEDGRITLEYYDQTVTRSAAVGWQYRTEYADSGEKQRFGMIVTGTICDACGNTDHKHHEACLADRTAIGRLVTLLLCLEDWHVDPHTLHREYEAMRDIDLAVGRAVTEVGS